MSCRTRIPSREVRERLVAENIARNIKLGRRLIMCETCKAGIHDVHYNEFGVAVCWCCGKDMTDDQHPRMT